MIILWTLWQYIVETPVRFEITPPPIFPHHHSPPAVIPRGPFSLPCDGCARFMTRTCTPSMINVSSPLYYYVCHAMTSVSHIRTTLPHNISILYGTETMCRTDKSTRRYRCLMFSATIQCYTNILLCVPTTRPTAARSNTNTYRLIFLLLL